MKALSDAADERGGEMKAYVLTKNLNVSVYGSSMMTKKWNELTCPSTDTQMNKNGINITIEFYSPTKRNKVLKCTIQRTNF